MSNTWISWNSNKKHEYKDIFYPENEQEISDIVKNARTVRMIGTGKSSADIIAGTETLISYEKYNQIINIDHENFTVTVQSGITLKQLLQRLEKEGLAFGALPDIDDISVGGAISTGTHGTGKIAQSLSEYIIAMKLIKANGEVLQLNQEDELLNAAKVSFGVLGIISEVTFQCQPISYLNLIERPMKDKEWLGDFRKMLAENDFLRILWLPHTNYGYVITGNYTEESQKISEISAPWFYKYRRALSKILYGWAVKKPSLTSWANKIIYALFFNHKQQKFGSLYDATVTKSRGSTLELAEWTVDIDKFEELFTDLKKELNSKNNDAYAHIPMDIRFIKSENGWLANAYGTDIVTMGCVSRSPEHADKYAAFDVVENVFLKYDGRPHWAKRFNAKEATLKKLYPRWEDFIKLRSQMDSEGKFLNNYLKKLLGID